MTKLENLNIGIFIDRDVTVRHFLDSEIFNGLKKDNNVKLIFPPLGDKRISSQKNAKKYGFDYQFISIPEKRILLWKWIFYIKTLSFKKGEDWKIIRKVYSYYVGKKMSFLFRLFSLPLIKNLVINILKLKINQYKTESLNSFINTFKPDILVHPSIFQGVYINELALISKKFGIPYLLLMNSWDNPCLKNTSIYEPSIVGVWGEQTKYHAIKYMGLNPKKVRILGSAQFQCFNYEYIRSRKDLLKEYGFSENTILILYAGSSKENNEFRHLQYLEKISLNLDKNIRIIYRAHPWLDDSETAREILNYNSSVIKLDKVMIPFMKDVVQKKNKSFFITDYKYTHDLLGAADIVISPLSTILIEALCHGKESICLIPEDEDIGTIFVDRKKLPCFQDVINSSAINTVENIDDLEESFKKSYAKCQKKETEFINRKNVQFFVDTNKPTYEERLNDCIYELTMQRKNNIQK